MSPATGFPSTSQLEYRTRRPEGARAITNYFDVASTILAYYIQKGVLSTTKSTDRGVKRAHFVVLQYAPCPAVLVECGFLSNRSEGARLANDAYRDTVADGIARGILTYASRVRETRLQRIPLILPPDPSTPTPTGRPADR